MGRLSNLLIGIIIVFTLILFTLSPANAKQAKSMELKFAAFLPPVASVGSMWRYWGTEVEKRTQGRVKVKIYWMGSLVRKDHRRSLLKGLSDVTFLSCSMDDSNYRLNMVMNLPMMNFPNEKVATRIRGEIIEKFPEVKAEYKGTKIMWIATTLPHSIHTTKKPIRTPGDLKGVKISGMGMNLKVLEMLDAVPITLSPMEAYMGLERGVADGSLAPYTPIVDLRMIKLLKYHNNTIMNYDSDHVIMNQKKWASLPADIKKILDDLNVVMQRKNLDNQISYETKCLETGKKLGHTFTQNTPEEKAVWREKLKPLHDKWIADNEAKGLPARAVYNEVKRLIKEYSK